jgi:hypothetical protein
LLPSAPLIPPCHRTENHHRCEEERKCKKLRVMVKREVVLTYQPYGEEITYTRRVYPIVIF